MCPTDARFPRLEVHGVVPFFSVLGVGGMGVPNSAKRCAGRACLRLRVIQALKCVLFCFWKGGTFCAGFSKILKSVRDFPAHSYMLSQINFMALILLHFVGFCHGIAEILCGLFLYGIFQYPEICAGFPAQNKNPAHLCGKKKKLLPAHNRHIHLSDPLSPDQFKCRLFDTWSLLLFSRTILKKVYWQVSSCFSLSIIINFLMCEFNAIKMGERKIPNSGPFFRKRNFNSKVRDIYIISWWQIKRNENSWGLVSRTIVHLLLSVNYLFLSWGWKFW